MKSAITILVFATAISPLQAQQSIPDGSERNRRLFTTETFGGNGRTCLTCHSFDTGTVSPEDALDRLSPHHRNLVAAKCEPGGRPDGQVCDIAARDTDHTKHPPLDPVLMLDGREPNLPTQALHAIQAHFQPTILPTQPDLLGISQFELSEPFYSSPTLRDYARGGPAPVLPQGSTDSEKRGRLFFRGYAILYPVGRRALARSVIAARCSIKPTHFSLPPRAGSSRRVHGFKTSAYRS